MDFDESLSLASCVAADHTRTIHETTPNRTNKGASCGFVDRLPQQADLSKPEGHDTAEVLWKFRRVLRPARRLRAGRQGKTRGVEA